MTLKIFLAVLLLMCFFPRCCIANELNALQIGLTSSDDLNRLMADNLDFENRLGEKYFELGFSLNRERQIVIQSTINQYYERLQLINTTSFTNADWEIFNSFKWHLYISKKQFSPSILAVANAQPVSTFDGIQVAYPSLILNFIASHQTHTIENFDSILSKNKEYSLWLEHVQTELQLGLENGIIMPRSSIELFVKQLDVQIEPEKGESVFFLPAKYIPEDFDSSEKARLELEYRQVTYEEILPALIRLRSFLQTKYLPNARKNLGLARMKGGSDYYNFLIERNSTLPLDDQSVHKLGLDEVARIKKEMKKAISQAGFKRGLSRFFEEYRNNPKFKFNSSEEMIKKFDVVGEEVKSNLHYLFYLNPCETFKTYQMNAIRADSGLVALYVPTENKGNGENILYLNTHSPQSHSKYDVEAIYLHEAIPGHHYQLSIARANTDLAPTLKFKRNPAFSEGWALYAETLGPRLGLYKTPLSKFGALNLEMLRALRLVVDTGIHSYGWSRAQAVNYIIQNSGVDRSTANAEVERYIATPGQALSYKIGELTIKDLGNRARSALKGRYDIREFHSKVLESGEVPLSILQDKINDWIIVSKP